MVSSTSRTFCRICHAACPVEVEIEENKVISVRGVKEDPLFKGYTCIKGRQIPDQINSQERLRFHLRKAQDGHFEEDKKATQFDTSSPVPNLPMGILDVKYSLNFSAIFIVMSDTIKPGDTQLTVIFFFAYSIAKLLDIPIRPALEAE